MQSYKIVRPYKLLLAILMAVAGCKNYKVVAVKSDITVPQTYSGKTDTTGIVKLPIKQFFDDDYLVKLIDTALKANPDIQSAFQRVEVAAANFKYNKSWLTPSV